MTYIHINIYGAWNLRAMQRCHDSMSPYSWNELDQSRLSARASRTTSLFMSDQTAHWSRASWPWPRASQSHVSSRILPAGSALLARFLLLLMTVAGVTPIAVAVNLTIPMRKIIARIRNTLFDWNINSKIWYYVKSTSLKNLKNLN